MKRTTIVADEGLLLEIKQLAEEEDHSVSDVIQEALRQYVRTKRRTKRSKISFVAAGQSGHADVSERVEEILESDAERLNIRKILTLDRLHFATLRPSHCASFDILP